MDCFRLLYMLVGVQFITSVLAKQSLCRSHEFGILKLQLLLHPLRRLTQLVYLFIFKRMLTYIFCDHKPINIL